MSHDTFNQVRKAIRQRMTELDVPSVGAGVAQHGHIIWKEGFGWVDREKRLAAHEQIAYPLASVTKPMTATAIMRLVELGKLDLDKPVNHYLSEQCQLKVWVGDPDSLTIRRLANHTAGLTTSFNMHLPDDRVPMPPQEESIRRYGHAVTMPGERYRYANFGYGILDHLVARVSGESFADFMHREVFVPLGMCRSAIGVPDRLARFTAARYDDDQDTMSMTLSVTPNGDIHAKAGEHQQTTLVNGVRFEDGWLTGTLAGMIETDDANRRPRHPSHHLQLDLKLRDDHLTGAVLSIAGHTLSHWVDLRRVEDLHTSTTSRDDQHC